MQKVTVLNQIEVVANGVIQARFARRIVDGDSVAASEWHRTVFSVDCDINAQMAAVNAHLAQMGWPAVSAEDIQRVKDHAAVAWTPAVIAAFKARQDEQFATLGAAQR